MGVSEQFQQIDSLDSLLVSIARWGSQSWSSKVSHLPKCRLDQARCNTCQCPNNPPITFFSFATLILHQTSNFWCVSIMDKKGNIMHTRFVVLLKNQDFLRKRSNICFQQFLSSQHDEMALFGMECLFTIYYSVHKHFAWEMVFSKNQACIYQLFSL